MNMGIAKALRTEGYMTPLELQWLAAQAQKHHVIVELGSYMGRSTRALGDNVDGKVIAIDDWRGLEGSILPEIERPGLHQKFLDNTEDLIKSGKVEYLILDHSQYDKIPQNIFPDMVFIDGDHSYKAVKGDIEFWSRRMSKGLICGHDAQSVFITQAVKEAFGSIQISPDTTIWYQEL